MQTIVSDNKLIFSNYGEYIVLWPGKICLAIFLFIQRKIGKGQIFMATLQKDKSNPVWCNHVR